MEGSSTTNWKLVIFQGAIIVVAGLWVFWPVLYGGWLWDDDLLITKNVIVQDPDGLWKIWFEPDKLFDYFPLTVSVQWLEWNLWHNDPFGYHLINILLHICSSLLVWRLLSKFGLRLAWLGGLLFAVHPVVVESVAWIAELKNTLSLVPLLLVMCSWIDYDKRKNRKDYLLALGLFLVAMLCKTTMVMFPVVILLYAWWKRGRVGWNDVKISTPFFVISLVLGLATIWFLHAHAIGENVIAIEGFFSRLALAALSIAFYFSKSFWPVGLVPIYPKWIIDPPSLTQFLPWPILAIIIYGLWIKRASWGRHILFGLGFFLIMLMPFVGFTSGSYMEFTWVMDHILYIPVIGLIGLAVAGVEQASRKMAPLFRPFVVGIVLVVAALLAWGSHEYAGIFVNEEALWTYTIQRNPGAWIAHYNLGFTLSQADRVDEAILQYEETLKINPDYASAHNNLGNVLSEANRLPEAIDQFEQALSLKPNYVEAHNNLGIAYMQNGQKDKAIEQFKAALEIDPNFVGAYSNLGNALMDNKQFSEAIEQYELALWNNPNDTKTHYNLALAFARVGRIPEAIQQCELSLKIDPSDVHVSDLLQQLQHPQQDASQTESSAK